jgi:hypothetical protein
MDVMDMELYDELDGVEHLVKTLMPFFKTGSREICNPPPVDTDCDFVVLDITGGVNFEGNGFTLTTQDRRAEYGESDFETYRRGEVNLIVVHDWTSFKKWRVATAACKQMNVRDKKKRIAIFQGVLYGDW